MVFLARNLRTPNPESICIQTSVRQTFLHLLDGFLGILPGSFVEWHPRLVVSGVDFDVNRDSMMAMANK